ncbi:hypothetical protein [Streptomyces sp. NPDC003456]|uniref:hypothetical protein n=1 Tax=Streptomyces sp. NPDC003456 TaxID=3364683 RepID=UPI0036B0CA28
MPRRTVPWVIALCLALLTGCAGAADGEAGGGRKAAAPSDPAGTPAPPAASTAAAASPSAAPGTPAGKAGTCGARPGPEDATRPYTEGTYRVPQDICPGLYSTLGAIDASEGRCSMANKSSDIHHKVKSVNTPVGQMATFQVEPADEVIVVSDNCEPWLRVE